MAAVMSSQEWITIEASYDLLGFLFLIRDMCNDTDVEDIIVYVEKDMEMLTYYFNTGTKISPVSTTALPV